jgi:hypothetical protein
LCFDAPCVSIHADATEVVEGAGISFHISRSDTEGSLTVWYELDSSSTVSSSDYTPQLSGSISIPDGESLVELSVMAQDDGLIERPETLTLKLLPFAPGTAGPSQYIIEEPDTASVELHDDFTDGVDADWSVEWQDIDQVWHPSPDNQVLWDDEPHRWIPDLPSSIAALSPKYAGSSGRLASRKLNG